MVDVGENSKLRRLRSVCAVCPVAGECLRDVMSMEQMVRQYGPVRVGVTGPKGWKAAELLVAEFAPVTDDDWSVLAAWICEDPREVRSVVAA